MAQETDDPARVALTGSFLCQSRVPRTATKAQQSCDLTKAQLTALVTPGFARSGTSSDPADTLGIRHPPVRRLVARLAQAGLVERREDATGHRYTLTRFTTDGDTMVQRVRQGAVPLSDRARAAPWPGLAAPVRAVPSALALDPGGGAAMPGAPGPGRHADAAP